MSGWTRQSGQVSTAWLNCISENDIKEDGNLRNIRAQFIQAGEGSVPPGVIEATYREAYGGIL